MAAMVGYGLGFALPASVFVVLGVVLELVFWFRLFRRRRSS
jgi:hypothetical protein